MAAKQSRVHHPWDGTRDRKTCKFRRYVLSAQQLPSEQPSFAGTVADFPFTQFPQPSAQHDFSSQQAESQSPEAQASGVQSQSAQQDSGADTGLAPERL